MRFTHEEDAAVAAAAAVAAVAEVAVQNAQRPKMSIRSLHLFSAQEVFDFVVTKLVEQGRGGYERNSCRFLTSDGARCAVGQLLWDAPDEEVRGWMGGLRCITQDYSESLGWRVNPHTRLLAHHQLLSHLMSAHDNAASGPPTYFLLHFLRDARGVAALFNLELTPNVPWSSAPH